MRRPIVTDVPWSMCVCLLDAAVGLKRLNSRFLDWDLDSGWPKETLGGGPGPLRGKEPFGDCSTTEMQ